MTLPTFDFTLNKTDQNLLKTLHTLLRIEEKQDFTSDDFRMYGLDRFLRDTQNGLGGLFAKWKHHKLIIDTGKRRRSQLTSNHLREIKVWRFPTEEVKP